MCALQARELSGALCIFDADSRSAAAGGSGRFVVEGETGLVVPDSEPASWARALHALLEDRATLRAMGHAARAWSLRHVPTWHEVLVDDLLPVWRQLAFPVEHEGGLAAENVGARREIGARRGGVR